MVMEKASGTNHKEDTEDKKKKQEQLQQFHQNWLFLY